MADTNKKRVHVPNVTRLELLEPRVLYSAEAAPLAALLDSGDAETNQLAYSLVGTDALKKLVQHGDDAENSLVVLADVQHVTELVLVVAGDSKIDELILLLQTEIADNASVELVVINNTDNILQSFADAASSYHQLNAVHIISHAADGELLFGEQTVNRQTLLENQDDLQRLGAALKIDGDILLYGCNLSSTDTGHEFAKTLSLLTDADVASSHDVTGHDTLGGDWDLEVVEGEIESGVIASQSIQQNWLGTLNINAGLIHHYLLNGDGTDLVGSSDMFVHNGVTFETGPENLAADFGEIFTGNFAHLELPAWTSPSFATGDFTIAMRVSPTANDNNAIIMSNNGGSSSTLGYTLDINNAGQARFTVTDGSSSHFVITSPSLVDGEWSHITVTRSNNALNMTVSRLSTGAVFSGYGGVGAGDVDLSILNPVLFAVGNASGASDYDGLIDDIRIYNRALNSADIAAIQNAGTSGGSGGINNAPIAGNGVLPTVSEDDPTYAGDTISNVLSASFSDLDVGDALSGILVTDNPSNATEGTWQYSTNGGAVWYAIGAVSETNALALSSTTTIRFDAAADYSGTVSDLQFRVLDNHYVGPNSPVDFTVGAAREMADASVNGFASSVSANLGQLGITVLPVNDSPSISSVALPTLLEDSGAPVGERISDVYSSTFNDPDVGATLAGIAIVSNTATSEGDWSYSQNGSTWYFVTSVSSSNALVLPSNYYILFWPAVNYNGTPPDLEVRAIDDTYTGLFSNGASKAYLNAGSFGAGSPLSQATTQLSTHVRPVNDAPVASDDAYTISEGALINLDLQSNDIDIDGDTLSIGMNSSPTSGTTTILADGTINYQHDGSETLSDSFNYSISDGLSGSIATVTITVNPVNDAPLVQPILVTDPTESDLAGFVVAQVSATDAEGDAMTVVLSGADASLFTVNAANEIVLAQPIDHETIAAASIDVVVRDSLGADSAVQTLTINIGDVNEAPSVTNASLAGVLEDTTNPSGSSVYNLFAAATTDIDAGDDLSGIAIVTNNEVATVGQWQYSNDQVNWVYIGGTSTTTALAISASSYIRFVPFQDYNGPVQALEIHALDLAYSGFSAPAAPVYIDASTASAFGAISINSAVLNTAVNAVNDSPMVANAAIANSDEDNLNPNFATVSDLFSPGFTDPDSGDTLKGIVVIDDFSTAAQGQWEYAISGGVWKPIGTVSSTASLLLNATTALRFVPAADFNGSVGALEVRALDSSWSLSFTNSTNKIYTNTTTVASNSYLSINTGLLTTTVNPINDAPGVVLATSSLSVNENAAANTSVGAVVAQDIDDSLGFTYALATDAGGRFDIDALTGEISVQPGVMLDHEAFSSHNIDVVVVDPAGNAGAATFIVSVNNVNERPTLTSSPAPINIYEDQTNLSGQQVGTMFSSLFSDQDAGQSMSGIAIVVNNSNPTDGVWQYKASGFGIWYDVGLVASNPLRLGVGDDLRFVPALNSTGPAPTLEVHVLDSTYNGGATISPQYVANLVANAGTAVSAGSYSISANILPQNDPPFDILVTTPLQVNEHAPTGTIVGTVAAQDIDSSVFTYDMTNTAGGLFSVDAVTGDVLVANGASIDFETGVTHQITVRATDNASASFSKNLSVTVMDINEPPSLVSQVNLISVLEDSNAPAGQTIASAFQSAFIDSDAGQSLGGIAVVGNNSLTTGSWQYQTSGAGLWTDIGAVNGLNALVLSSTDSIRFVPAANYSGPAETLSVHVLDNQYTGPTGNYEANVFSIAASSISLNTHTVGIVVDEVNDAPYAIVAATPLVIAENALLNDSVGIVQGADTDDSVLTYSLMLDALGRFGISSSTGEIYVLDSSQIDFETNSVHQIMVSVTDSNMMSYNENFTVQVINTNESPVLLPQTLPPQSEDTLSPNPASISAIFTTNFADQDAGDTFQAVAVVGNPSMVEGQWQFKTGTGNWRDVGGVSPTNALILSANDLLRFSPSQNYTGSAPQLSLYAIDSQYVGAVTSITNLVYSNNIGSDVGSSLSLAPATLDVFLTPVNDPPAITLNPILNIIAENTSVSNPIDVANIVVSDVDGGLNMLSLSGTHAGSFQLSGNKLQLKPGVSLDFESMSQLDVDVLVDDASVGGGVDGSVSYVLMISDIVEPPVVTNIESTITSYIENSDPIVISSTINVEDPDNAQLLSATVAITTSVSSDDALVFTNQNGIAGQYDSNTGVLTLSGSASSADYEAALQSVKYIHVGDSPSANQRTIEFQVSSGSGNSNIVSRHIDIIAVNDAPAVVVNPIIASIYENADVTSTRDVADIVVSDVDGGVNALSLTGTHASYFQITGNTLQLKSQVVLDTENVAQLNVSVVVDDASVGTGSDDAAAFALLIDNIDEPPIISNVESSVITYVENAAPAVLSSTLVIADPDSAQLVSAQVRLEYSESTLEELIFVDQNGIIGSYDSTTGLLSLTGTASIADYEAALRSVRYVSFSENAQASQRMVYFNVNDGSADSNEIGRLLQFVPINDAPTVALNPILLSLSESADTSVAIDVADITVSDVDAGVNGLSLSGSNAPLFQISGNKLQLKPGISLDTETEPQLDVNVLVGDASIGIGVDQIAAYSISITDVNEPPFISNIGASALIYTENDDAVAISSTVVIADVDSAQMQSATVRFVQQVSDNDSLIFTDQNGISGQYDNVTGVMTLSGTATIAEYQSALRSVMFANSHDAPMSTQREIEIQISDGNTLSNVVSRMVDVVPVNDEQQLVVNMGASIVLGNSLIVTKEMLLAIDSDNSPVQLVYSVESGWSEMQLLVDGVTASSFTQQDIEDGLVLVISTGAAAGMLALPLELDDGQGTVTAFILNINVKAIPEPAVAAALPASETEVEETIISELSIPVANLSIDFESISQETDISAFSAVEAGLQQVVDQPVAAENVSEQHHAGGNEPIAVINVPDFSSHASTVDAAQIIGALATPLQTIKQSVDLSSADLMEEQLASLLLLDPYHELALSSFDTQERNAGLQRSVMQMQDDLAQSAEDVYGNTVARDTIIGFSLSITASFLVWLLRGGALLASMFSIAPLWRQLDPLPVVNSTSDELVGSDADDSVEKLFDDEY